jgi:hypothetical protein
MSGSAQRVFPINYYHLSSYHIRFNMTEVGPTGITKRGSFRVGRKVTDLSQVKHG